MGAISCDALSDVARRGRSTLVIVWRSLLGNPVRSHVSARGQQEFCALVRCRERRGAVCEMYDREKSDPRSSSREATNQWRQTTCTDVGGVQGRGPSGDVISKAYGFGVTVPAEH